MITAKRNGAFVIELMNAIGDGSITELVLKPASLDIADRWGSDQIKSTMGLLAVLTSVPEKELINLEYPDVDRVMSILAIHLPAGIRAGIESGNKPLTTPKFSPTPANQHEEMMPGDSDDPRFPATDAPVQPWAGDKPPPEHDDFSGFSASPPQAARKVG